NIIFDPMGRILGIDYGLKRTGIATTDPLQIIVNGLATVETSQLESFLQEYVAKEEVDKIVIGQSFHADGSMTDHENKIFALIGFLNNEFPNISIDRQDESFTSRMAKTILVAAGVPKMKRRNKDEVDKLSAVLILQQYLGHI
ncbi:MAG TPA: Holliday junction resolvase RuvX, partial [Saprospiraceae bacterium]|nr:Holliday junction resolvase RuvX [Saprospiraceae bacterium]